MSWPMSLYFSAFPASHFPLLLLCLAVHASSLTEIHLHHDADQRPALQPVIIFRAAMAAFIL